MDDLQTGHDVFLLSHGSMHCQKKKNWALLTTNVCIDIRDAFTCKNWINGKVMVCKFLQLCEICGSKGGGGLLLLRLEFRDKLHRALQDHSA